MQKWKKGIVVFATAALCFSAMEIGANAQTNTDSLHNMQRNLQSNQQAISEKEKEQQAVNEDLNNVKNEWESLQSLIQKNKEEISTIEDKIKSVNKIIEEKKQEIVQLEDQVMARKDIIKKRLVAFQKRGRINFVLDALLNAESFDDLVNRISAISTLLSADSEILDQQKQDLKKIENDKKEIAKKEEELVSERKKLAASQEELQAKLASKQEVMTALQEKYKNINQDLLQAKKTKSSLESQINTIQENIRKERAAAKARILDEQRTIVSAPQAPSASGTEIYMNATAYSYQDTKGHVTSLGYDIRKNPNMKLIAVDPNVVPLGSKVWVEGYGVAIAGDTGGAIKGHRIDILMPSHKAAVSFGRRTVKIKVLN